MNILLVYPEVPDTFWSFKHALRFIHKKAANPPLGLLTVAAMLPPSWGKRLVDLNVSSLTQVDLAWADYVFVSAMTVQQASAQRIIAQCHRAGVPVVAGGPLFTTEPELFPDVDHLILGEAEVSLPPFLSDLQQNRAQRIYAASGYADMHKSPPPMWELLDFRSYAGMSVQWSRGCPYDCEFCSVTALLGHRPRTKSAGQMIRELEGLYDLGWHRNVFFVDDNFIGNKRDLTMELLPELIEWRKTRPGMEFNTEASINLADDPALMNSMVKAGFTMVFVGVETPDEASLAECSKKHNLHRDMLADVKRMQQAGLQVQGGFILGFDADTPSSFQRVTQFIQSAGIVTAMIGLLQALPGTRLYERLKKVGRVLSVSSGDNVNGTTNIVPVMGIGVLHERYRDALLRLYAPKAYYQRVKSFLRVYEIPSLKRGPLEFGFFFMELRAFAASIARLGILGKERLEYWKLLIWTAFCRPRAFGLAVTFAIYGYHFRRTCEMHVS